MATSTLESDEGPRQHHNHIGIRGGIDRTLRQSSYHRAPLMLHGKAERMGNLPPGPCALGRPPRSLLGTKWELVRMSGDSELDLEGRLLEWWSSGEEGVIQLGSSANSCKEVGSGRFPT
ncbi:hypothetical protein GW17_00028224 [Ensete ventricosum]|nr:hypothetical protein GW17_00028224 [Ensete ventricosum]